MQLLFVLGLCQSAEPAPKRRRIFSAAHALKIKNISSTARCLVTDYTHRPEQMTMNLLIKDKESHSNAHWRDLCQQTIQRKVLGADRAAIPFEMMPNDNLYVLDFEQDPDVLGLPLFPEIYKIIVSTTLKDGSGFFQKVKFNPATTTQVYVHVSRTTWRIGSAVFKHQSDTPLSTVEVVPVGYGWGLKNVRKVEMKTMDYDEDSAY